jgi:hypothetical protein
MRRSFLGRAAIGSLFRRMSGTPRPGMIGGAGVAAWRRLAASKNPFHGVPSGLLRRFILGRDILGLRLGAGYDSPLTLAR